METYTIDYYHKPGEQPYHSEEIREDDRWKVYRHGREYLRHRDGRYDFFIVFDHTGKRLYHSILGSYDY